MFQLETEDMLPRMAPKPSSDIPSEDTNGLIRPQVPEVSILFGKQEANLQQQTLNTVSQPENKVPQQTYAAWKKQMLPKVTYPASANMVEMQPQEKMQDYKSLGTNLYPVTSNITPPLNIAANTNLNGFAGSNFGGGITNQLGYQRSLESCNNNMYQQVHHYPTLPLHTPLATFNQTSKSKDVLSICAGTQTDAILDPPNYLQHLQSTPFSNLATQQDVESIRKILDELKVEQQRMLKMLEAHLFSIQSQAAVKVQCRDVGVQVNFIESDNFPCVNGDLASVQDQHLVAKNKFLEHLKPTSNMLQSPKSKPMAQSTAYRPNSPQFPISQRESPEMAPVSTNQQIYHKPTPIMPKSASDTSLAMNELALKYLPNEKLAELLKELNMEYPLATADLNVPTSPARTNMNKFEKGSTDISNDSYKYLKKYRLLPEEQDNGNNPVKNDANGIIGNGNDNDMQYNSPQYNIRNTAVNQRQTQTKKCSPFAGRLPLSPLARASPPQSSAQQHLVNLENIRHQPKFL